MRRIECRSKSLSAFTETVKRNPRYSVMNPPFERPIAERENEGAAAVIEVEAFALSYAIVRASWHRINESKPW